jgi:uncharacterized protein (TIGR03435 family)
MRTLLLAGLVACAAAQTNTSGFEAASVKPSKSGSFSSSSNTRRDNVEIKNETLRDIITEAFELKDYQVTGPDWLSSERFDIVAKAPHGTGDDEKLMPLLRTLLAERFKLETHRETKELPVYGLVVGKGGFKLQAVEVKQGAGLNGNSDNSGGDLKARGITMEELAEWMSRHMDRPVVDMTGLKDSYSFTLMYSREDKGQTGTTTHPVLPLAIQEQLGLRLEKRTAPVQMLVVDRAEKVPVEN